MRLEILDAEEEDGKYILRMSYDQEFEDAVAKVFGVSYIQREDLEDFILMVLSNLDPYELLEQRDEID